MEAFSSGQYSKVQPDRCGQTAVSQIEEFHASLMQKKQ